LAFHFKLDFEPTLIIIVAWSTMVWLIVTYLTKPTDNETLLTFYRKVHPGGPGWKHIEAQLPDVKGDKGFGKMFVNYFAGCFLVLFSLFGIGRIIFGQYTSAIIFLSVAAIAGFIIYRNLTRMGWEKVIK
jgi:solute:Na+ symporter, SSS family